MQARIKSIYQSVAVALLAMGLGAPGCGLGDKSETPPANISAAKDAQSFEEKLAAVPWLKSTVSGDLIIRNSPGRDPAVPLLITEVFPQLALTVGGQGLSKLPTDTQQSTIPLQVVASGDIVLDTETHLRVPGSLHLKGRRIIIKEGARLDVSGKLFIEAVVYSGLGSIVATAERHELVVNRAGIDGTRGTDGTSGNGGTNATCGYGCTAGSSAKNGTDGTNATDGGNIAVKVDYLDSSDSLIVTGGNGGDGGSGGAGGAGGHQVCCFLWCTPGCPGGVGGNGGNGGNGGQGGNITVEYCTRSSSRPVLAAGGGRGGQGGLAGVGGVPSNGGCELTGCRTSHPTVGGVPGKQGRPGWDGIATVLRRKDCP